MKQQQQTSKPLKEFVIEGWDSEHDWGRINVMARNATKARQQARKGGFTIKKMWGPNDQRPQEGTP